MTRRITMLLIFTPIAFAPGRITLAGKASGRCYLLSYFTRNGEDGLHLAASDDGIRWTVPRDTSYLKPEVGGKLMRDPSIVQGPDGTFHMVWTTGRWVKNIGYAQSKDLIHWSKQKKIFVFILLIYQTRKSRCL